MELIVLLEEIVLDCCCGLEILQDMFNEWGGIDG